MVDRSWAGSGRSASRLRRRIGDSQLFNTPEKAVRQQVVAAEMRMSLSQRRHEVGEVEASVLGPLRRPPLQGASIGKI